MPSVASSFTAAAAAALGARALDVHNDELGIAMHSSAPATFNRTRFLDRGPLFFSHLPKTGGTRFGLLVTTVLAPQDEAAFHQCHVRGLLADKDHYVRSIWLDGRIKRVYKLLKYSADECDFVWDHSDYSLKIALDALVPRPFRFVALARDPLTIAQSSYFYAHLKDYDVERGEWPAVVADPAAIVRHVERYHGDNTGLSLAAWLSGCSWSRVALFAQEVRQNARLRGAQAALDAHSAATCGNATASLARAHATVETALMIGVTEQMDSSVCLLYKLLYAPHDHDTKCADVFTKTTTTTNRGDRTNQTPDYSYLLVPAVVEASRAAAGGADIELYEMIKARFAATCRAHHVEVGVGPAAASSSVEGPHQQPRQRMTPQQQPQDAATLGAADDGRELKAAAATA